MPESLIRINDIEKFSIVDFPSKMAAVVFMQGCPWRCPFCYNQSLQKTECDSEVSWETLIRLLEHRKGILDAVVFSGGEPLLQENLPQAMDEVKSLGFEIGLHTGGFASAALRRVIEKINWCGLDIKAPLTDERYHRASGSTTPVVCIRQSLQLLLDSGVHFECRTTCDPRILDTADIYSIADELSALGVKEYYLQKYRPVTSDKTTTDTDCEKFFNNTGLTEYLKSKFEVFDMRK